MMYRLICWLLILFACFYGLGAYPLLDDNEGLYAAIARDMLHSGQFIVPHLNGMPYIEKPPMLYWLLAGSMSIFGVNEWAVRLVPALALFLTAWRTQRFMVRIKASETASLIAPLIMVTSLPLLVMGRMLLCDMILTCFFSAALMEFYEWYANLFPPDRRGRKYLYYFYALLALAVLTKGFVALILAGGTITVFLLWQHAPVAHYRRLLSPGGILIFLLIAAPWHIAATAMEPGFAWFYFINEHLMRFLNMRQPHDYYTGPPWYYLPRILAYVAPWTLFLLLLNPLSVWERIRVRAYQDIKPSPGATRHPLSKGEVILQKFLWSWVLFCLVFFSISGGKANYYMIVGMPPLIMLLAMRLQEYSETGNRMLRWLASASLLLIVVAFYAVKYACHESSGDLYSTCKAVTWPVISYVLLYVIAATTLCWRIPPRWILPLVGTHILFSLPLLICGASISDDTISQKKVAEYLKASSHDQTAIYQEFEELSALAFYIDKPLVVVDSISSDLLYGQHQSPGGPYFLSMAQWAKQSPPLPLVILNKRLDKFMRDLKNTGVDLQGVCIVRRFERVAVIEMCHGHE